MKANLPYKISLLTFVTTLALLGSAGKGLCADATGVAWTNKTFSFVDLTTKTTVTGNLPKNCTVDGGSVRIDGGAYLHCAQKQILKCKSSSGKLSFTVIPTIAGNHVGAYQPKGITYLESKGTVTSVDSETGLPRGVFNVPKGGGFFGGPTGAFGLASGEITPLDVVTLAPKAGAPSITLPGTEPVKGFGSFQEFGLFAVNQGSELWYIDSQKGTVISQMSWDFGFNTFSPDSVVGANEGTGIIFGVPSGTPETFSSSLQMSSITSDGNNNIIATAPNTLLLFNPDGTLKSQTTVPGLKGFITFPYTLYQGAITGQVGNQSTQEFNADHTSSTVTSGPVTIDLSFLQANRGQAPVYQAITNFETGDPLATLDTFNTLYNGPTTLNDGIGFNATGGDAKSVFQQTTVISPSGTTLDTNILLFDANTTGGAQFSFPETGGTSSFTLFPSTSGPP
ncbi:MAG: hypothetical protein ACLQVJ_16875 [Syntrophobacteraceae bacterium]